MNFCGVTGKQCHKSKSGAGRQAAELRKSKRLGTLETYKCQFCAHWHIGHRGVAYAELRRRK